MFGQSTRFIRGSAKSRLGSGSARWFSNGYQAALAVKAAGGAYAVRGRSPANIGLAFAPKAVSHGASFDHLSRLQQNRLRNLDSGRLGGLEVDKSLKFRRLLHRQAEVFQIPATACKNVASACNRTRFLVDPGLLLHTDLGDKLLRCDALYQQKNARFDDLVVLLKPRLVRFVQRILCRE